MLIHSNNAMYIVHNALLSEWIKINTKHFELLWHDSFDWIRYADKFQGGDSGSDFLRVEGYLTGESFASSYGYELATLDINGDK